MKDNNSFLEFNESGLYDLFKEVIQDKESSSFIKAMEPATFMDYMQNEHLRKKHKIGYDGIYYKMNVVMFTNFVNDVVQSEVDKDIMRLVSEGKVEVYWDDNTKEFRFNPIDRAENNSSD